LSLTKNYLLKACLSFDMKIGIYGDSFADPNPYPDGSWIHSLKNHIAIDAVEVFATSGTSHWWSYQRFLKTYKQFDTIIFCHTNAIRWPHLPREYESRAWNVGHRGKNIVTNNFQEKINEVFLDIFTEELLTYISTNIFKDVNDKCRREGIYLINLLMEEQRDKVTMDSYQYDLVETPYPILHNMHGVSKIEHTLFKEKDYVTVELLAKLKTMDIRANHISPINNDALAKYLASLLCERKKDVCVNLLDLGIWSKYDKEFEKRFDGLEW